MAKKATKAPAKPTKKPPQKATKPKAAKKPTAKSAPKQSKAAAKPTKAGRKPSERVKFGATVSRETHQYLAQLSDPGSMIDKLVAGVVSGKGAPAPKIDVDAVRKASDLLLAALA